MKGLSFFSRLAFLCNVLFIVCLVIQRTEVSMAQGVISSTVITLGWFLAPILNLVVNIFYAMVLLKRKQLPAPKWVVTLNVFFLALQFFYHFILPS